MQRKEDDSPLTAADLESQRVIIEGLRAMTPDIPVLSEESAQAPWSERRTWRELWVVDPLDGTREFVKRNGEFTVNIALVQEHEARARDRGGARPRALVLGRCRSRRFQPSPRRGPRERAGICAAEPLACGRQPFARKQGDAGYLATLGPHVLSGLGSSLKFCLIAEGKADLYPRFGPTSEWDTAAGQAVLEAAGGRVTRLDGHRLRYNCRESLINGDFLACGAI